MVYISYVAPSRVEMNAMRFPALFHLGKEFSPAEVRDSLKALPSGSMVYICSVPDRFEAKVILLLGPHDGSVSSPSLRVALAAPVPFEFITYMSLCPSRRSDLKAIFVSSGDHVCWVSSAVLLVR